MEIEHVIRYAPLAVGLKPSAMQGEARLRGLERNNYSKTISPPALPAGRRLCAGEAGLRWLRRPCRRPSRLRAEPFRATAERRPVLIIAPGPDALSLSGTHRSSWWASAPKSNTFQISSSPPPQPAPAGGGRPASPQRGESGVYRALCARYCAQEPIRTPDGHCHGERERSTLLARRSIASATLRSLHAVAGAPRNDSRPMGFRIGVLLHDVSAGKPSFDTPLRGYPGLSRDEGSGCGFPECCASMMKQYRIGTKGKLSVTRCPGAAWHRLRDRSRPGVYVWEPSHDHVHQFARHDHDSAHGSVADETEDARIADRPLA